MPNVYFPISRDQTHLDINAFVTSQGQLEVVKHLLDYNASIFLVDMENRSPLHWAALGGHADVCDFLIQKGFSRAFFMSSTMKLCY